MTELPTRPDNATRTERGSLTRSMAATAFQPRRYYLMPLKVNATHYTVTAIPKWMDKHQVQRRPDGPSGIRPTLLEVVVLLLVARGILRASSGRRHR